MTKFEVKISIIGKQYQEIIWAKTALEALHKLVIDNKLSHIHITQIVINRL